MPHSSNQFSSLHLPRFQRGIRVNLIKDTYFIIPTQQDNLQIFEVMCMVKNTFAFDTAFYVLIKVRCSSEPYVRRLHLRISSWIEICSTWPHPQYSTSGARNRSTSIYTTTYILRQQYVISLWLHRFEKMRQRGQNYISHARVPVGTHDSIWQLLLRLTASAISCRWKRMGEDKWGLEIKGGVAH